MCGFHFPRCPICNVEPMQEELKERDGRETSYALTCPKCGYRVIGKNLEEVVRKWVYHVQGRDIHDAVREMLD